jgi:hypothetical protein
MNKLNKLAEAYSILIGVEGFDLEAKRIKAVMMSILAQDKNDLVGKDYIDKLTDEELSAALRINDPRLDFAKCGFINPQIFNYIRLNRSNVAAVEFSRKGNTR